jgi:hypothetical protein
VERLPKDPVEQRARRPDLVREPNLAQDLPLAGNERVEPSCDAKEVVGRRSIVEPVERRLDVGLERRERCDGFALGRLRVFRGDVELGAVARREANDLAAALRKLRGESLRGIPLERDPLPQLDRSMVVRRADEDEADHPK